MKLPVRRTAPGKSAWQWDFSFRGKMSLPGKTIALMIATWLLGFLPAPGSAQAPSADDRKVTDVTGEVELRPASSTHPADASEVVVWLVPNASVQRVSAAPQRAHYRLLQRNKRFEPRLLVIPVGSVVDFPNADPWFHNVFSLYRGKRFDLGLYQAGAQRSVKFDRIGPSYLFCNIHPEMTGVVLVVDTDSFGISDKAGRFSIQDVPAGRYTVHVWYENATPESLKNLQRSVLIEGQNRAIPTISVPVAKQQGDHKNKYSQDYDPGTLRTDY
jgi:plastocyanin